VATEQAKGLATQIIKQLLFNRRPCGSGPAGGGGGGSGAAPMDM
jgi:hypothetical protein